MLYEDITEGAVVHGRVLAASTYAELETIQAKVEAMGATLFVAGDTSDRDECALEFGRAIVGVLVAKARAGEIGEVSPDAVRAASARLARLDWRKLAGFPPERVEVYDEATDASTYVDRGTFLLCWGRRPQVVLSVGREAASGPMAYDAHLTDDGFGHDASVDGRQIASTNYSECRYVDLSDEALARYRAMVPLHPQPKLYLTVRHD